MLRPSDGGDEALKLSHHPTPSGWARMLRETPVDSGSAVCHRAIPPRGGRPGYMRGHTYGFDLFEGGRFRVDLTEYATAGGVFLNRANFIRHFLPKGGVGMG